MRNKKQAISFFLLFISLHITGAELISGNAEAPEGQTFSFSIQPHALSQVSTFYVGALSTQGGANNVKNFAIASLAHDATNFTPLAPEVVSVNGIPGQTSPLFDQGIVALGVLQVTDGWFDKKELPVAVTQANPATIYLVDSTQTSGATIFSAPGINDAAGQVSAGVVSLTTDIDSHVFAAVSPHNGIFGEDNSGIAMVIRGFVSVEVEGEQKKIGVFSQVDGSTGSVIGNPKAVLLDTTSDVVAITSDLAFMGNVVAMHWSVSLNLLFIGLQVTAGSGAADGARAIVVGKLVDGGLQLQTIAPDTVFAPGNQTSVVGAVGAGAQLSINFLKTLFTSTAIQYLIVAGGNGAPGSNTQSIYAMPLVNVGAAAGSVASTNAQPQNVFSTGDVPVLVGRTITDPALQPADMPQATDAAVMVGGGPFTAGHITDMVVRDDTIFIFVGFSSGLTNQGATGVYYSQALFDPSGMVTAWTQWQRASGVAGPTFIGALDAIDGSFVLGLGNNAQGINTIERTVWSGGTSGQADVNPYTMDPVIALVDTALPSSTGSVQSLYTFLPSTPGLNNISVAAFGGSGSIVLVQTGTLNTVLTPTLAIDYAAVATFENGTITQNLTDTTAVVISGGVLDDIGPITATEIAQGSNNNGWLFVGGIDGLAVLANADGSGWNSAAGQLGDGFVGLVNGMQFVPIGDYSFIKKLIGDDAFLYVITDDLIDRIDLAASNFANNNLQRVTVATKQGLAGITSTGSIVDAIMSGSFGLLATTVGLWRVGNGAAINTALNENAVNWTPVAIPEGAGAPVQLRAATQTGRAQDVAQNNGGHVYVLTTNDGYNQSRINRYAVEGINNNPVNSTTIVPFDDLFVKNILSFFLNFGELKNIFTTDGALYWATRGKIENQPATVTLTPSFPEPRVGLSNIGERSVIQPISFGAVSMEGGVQINAFERSQGSGCWIVAGNFGMQVLE